MKYWKEIRNQRSVWLFAGGFVLLLGVMTGMLYTLGRRGIIPICGITAALLAMAISYTAELRCNMGRRRALENMLADGDRFTYEEHIENEDVMDSSLPVMTLQPLVENALSHGINRRIDGGKITMRVESVGSRLQISVEDNGVGIAEDELRRVRKSLRERSGPIERRADSSRSTGIALRNVNRRIQFYFGMQYGVDVASTQDIGTTVIVTLPQMRGN